MVSNEGLTSFPTYRTDKTTNQIISALDIGKKVLIKNDNESFFSISPILAYMKVKDLNNNAEMYILRSTDPVYIYSNSLQDPFTFNINTGGEHA